MAVKYIETRSNGEAVCMAVAMTNLLRSSGRKSRKNISFLPPSGMRIKCRVSVKGIIEFNQGWTSVTVSVGTRIPNAQILTDIVDKVFGAVSVDDTAHIDESLSNLGVFSVMSSVTPYMKSAASMRDENTVQKARGGPRLSARELELRAEHRKKEKREKVHASHVTNAIDLSGQTFGHLTVISGPHLLKEGQEYFWECECMCGSKVSVRSTLLRKRGKTDCGCGGIDRRGQKVGNFVIECRGPGETSCKTTNWIARCSECGHVSSFKNHKVRDYNGKCNGKFECECQKMSSESNMMSENFGLWKVVGRAKAEAGKKKDNWMCICEGCGKMNDSISGNNLRGGRTKSCPSCAKLYRNDINRRDICVIGEDGPTGRQGIASLGCGNQMVASFRIRKLSRQHPTLNFYAVYIDNSDGRLCVGMEISSSRAVRAIQH